MKEKKALTADETAYFCEQLALILNAGIQLSDGMEILAEDMEDEKIKSVASCLAKELNDEKTLFQAMEKSGMFPSYALNTVKIGVLTGRLEDVLRELTIYYERSGQLIRTVKSSVLHPFMLLVMMTAVIIVLVVQVIPMFGDIFARFDADVMNTASNSINSAYTAGLVILMILLAIIVISLLTAVFSKIPFVRSKLSRIFSGFVLTKRLSRTFAEAKFAGAMSMMVSSGIDPVEALENSLLIISDKGLSKQIEDCRRRVLEGEYFSDAICESKLLPSVYSRSLKIAYKSGAFDVTWKKISERCVEEAERNAGNIVAFIEPILIGILAISIGSILLTMMLPLMNIMSVIG